VSRISISSKVSDYFVDLPNHHFNLGDFSTRFWMVDSFFESSKDFPIETIFVQALEEKKHLGTCEEVLLSLANLGCTRQDFLAVVGGGFLQDIGTLASSLYMRGIEWIFFPTTLMSMLDSCVGGKSSINVQGKKNLIGNFHPPKEIHIFTQFIESLTKVDIASGLLEGIKICFARDPKTLDRFCENLHLVLSSEDNLDKVYRDLILQTLESKKWFLEIDEFDTKERQLLNFGHTFGHALEAATEYRIPHGIAVGFGMLAAIDFAKVSEDKPILELKDAIVKILDYSGFELSKINHLDQKLFLDAFNSDKKHTTETYYLILPDSRSLSKEGFAKSFEVRERVLESTFQVLSGFN